MGKPPAVFPSCQSTDNRRYTTGMKFCWYNTMLSSDVHLNLSDKSVRSTHKHGICTRPPILLGVNVD